MIRTQYLGSDNICNLFPNGSAGKKVKWKRKADRTVDVTKQRIFITFFFKFSSFIIVSKETMVV